MKPEYQIKEVKTREHIKQFHDCCFDIYCFFPCWVSPLISMVESVFNPKTNHLFEKGNCVRWIVYDQDNVCRGRIAAFYHPVKFKNEDTQDPIGAIGFFECEENYETAKLLLDKAIAWLQSQNLKEVIGPVNFGENDVFWGMLTDGYDRLPSFGMNYNPKYYKDYFEKYGFEIKYEQRTSTAFIKNSLPPRFKKIAEWVKKKNKVTVKSLSIKKMESFVDDFVEVYNDAWKDFKNFVLLDHSKALKDFEKFKTLANEDSSIFGYYEGKPVAFVLTILDGNELIYDFKGKLTLWNKIKFVLRKWLKISKRMRVIVMGTKKEYQKMGLESVLLNQMRENNEKTKKMEEVELSWVGDFNQEMLSIHRATISSQTKTHITYQKNI